ncbi:unnamed protein product [Prorocentrum cordatum]|uniref:Uncharacterized protein n=1 Tax=Prorocentrum cordatum TaxID=2364126 RepID=A0ABN9Q1M1_9DINO|nr:unnamed protein product [Polarella glacialis]
MGRECPETRWAGSALVAPPLVEAGVASIPTKQILEVQNEEEEEEEEDESPLASSCCTICTPAALADTSTDA